MNSQEAVISPEVSDDVDTHRAISISLSTDSALAGITPSPSSSKIQ